MTCFGEDKLASGSQDPVHHLPGQLAGSENQILPDATDYGLSADLNVTAISWTINLNTDRGVLTGKAVLAAATGATGTPIQARSP